MQDLISRQAAIDALAEHEKSKGHNYSLFVDIVSECAEIIRDIPPACQWIQCDEEMPEELYETGNGRQLSNHVLVTVYNKYDDDLFVDVGYTVDGNWLSATVTNPIPIELFDVLAWMPLPEPYKEGEGHETD